MAKVQLYSVAQGKLASFTLRVDLNNDVVAERGSVDDGNYEFLKFPGDVTKEELQALFELHNDQHKGVKGLTEEDLAEQEAKTQAAQDLVDSL